MSPAADPIAELAHWLPYGITCARRAASGYPSLHDDIASELALRLWRMFAAVRIDERGPRRLVAFVARRTARTVVARSRRQLRTFRQSAAVIDAHGDAVDALALIPSRDPDPADAAALADLIASIDPDVRTDAALRIDGATWREIGATRGVSGEAVRSRVAMRLDRSR